MPWRVRGRRERESRKKKTTKRSRCKSANLWIVKENLSGKGNCASRGSTHLSNRTLEGKGSVYRQEGECCTKKNYLCDGIDRSAQNVLKGMNDGIMGMNKAREMVLCRSHRGEFLKRV